MDIICDIDGTLADGSHREHLLNPPKKDWAAYQALAHLDGVHEHVAELLRALSDTDYRRVNIILCTGRGEHEREVTETWLDYHLIPYDFLFMRATGDYRPDDVIKEELLDKILAEGFSPDFVLDDRTRVVNMWRRRGIPCFQVAPGDF